MGTETPGNTETPANAAAETLRRALVDLLADRGIVRTGAVEQALRAVPRHLFVPAVPVEQAYADEPVAIKHDAAGISISAASQPAMVAIMLEQLQARQGHRILEIGAGTGYNAALLACLAGQDGRVITIDVDQDLTDSARNALVAAGYANVHVILGDGALGYPADAPYDRIIATVGAWDLPAAWLAQLAPGGRLLLPLRLRGSVTMSVALERDGGSWRAVSAVSCAFMPLREGIADDPRRVIPLTDDASVTLLAHQDQDISPDALAGVLTRPRSQEWTGVTFEGKQESVALLNLWLACRLPNAVSRMSVEQQAVAEGVITPMFDWGATATVEDDTLAYLTVRPSSQPGTGAAGAAGTVGAAGGEVGVIAHGSRGGDLAVTVAEHVRAWHRDYRDRTPRIRLQPVDAAEPVTGQFAFTTPNNRLVISWQ